jgi:hypothetical protein
MNKTITISFTATGNAKDANGQTKGFNTSVTRVIYVSSAGRLLCDTRPRMVGHVEAEILHQMILVRVRGAFVLRGTGWLALFLTPWGRVRLRCLSMLGFRVVRQASSKATQRAGPFSAKAQMV